MLINRCQHCDAVVVFLKPVLFVTAGFYFVIIRRRNDDAKYWFEAHA